jgi:Flp pilus assembly protein TadD
VKGKLLYGAALQRLDRPVSAEREFAAAAALAPGDPEAQVAAAVGSFSKDDPSRAFARLGPLARTYPHSPSVRFHLGLLLLWLRQVPQARKELREAVADAPGSALGREANTLLDSLRSIGTK